MNILFFVAALIHCCYFIKSSDNYEWISVRLRFCCVMFELLPWVIFSSKCTRRMFMLSGHFVLIGVRVFSIDTHSYDIWIRMTGKQTLKHISSNTERNIIHTLARTSISPEIYIIHYWMLQPFAHNWMR